MRKKNIVRFFVPGVIISTAILVVLVSLVTGMGKQWENLPEIHSEEAQEVSEKVRLTLEDEEETAEGTVYHIMVTNDSSYEFHEVELLLSHPLITQSGTMLNENYFGEEEIVGVFRAHSSEFFEILIPMEEASKESVDQEKIDAKITGYLKGMPSQKQERIGRLK